MVDSTLSQTEIDFDRSAGGVAQLDGARVREAIEAAIDEVLASIEGWNGEIVAVAMTTFWHSCVTLDDEGVPLLPVLTWADTRAQDDAQRLRDMLDETAVHQRTGCMLHPSYLPAKIAWLRRCEAEVFSRTRWIVSFAQYCTGVWLGTHASSISMASGSGLFNDLQMGWDGELLAALGIREDMLGTITGGAEMLPPLKEGYAARWPRLAGVPWRAPIGDGAASNVGAGCHSAERLALMVGTSGALRRCERQATPQTLASGLWRYRLDGQYSLTGGALSDAGNAHAWMLDTLQLPDEDALEAEMQSRAPAQHGLIVLPFWSGERSTGWAGDATATILGMKLHTTAVDMYQAAIEAVTYRFAALLDAFGRAGDTVVATGGGLRSSPAWLQLMADVLGTNVVASDVAESSMRGAAMVALRDVGALGSHMLLAAPTGATYQPRWDFHARHRDARLLQQELYEREVGADGERLLARQTR